MKEKNIEKTSDSQKNSVSLHQENKSNYDYGINNNGRTEASDSAGHVEEWSERLGLRAVAERGRPSLGHRWDIELYEEGIWSHETGDQLGSPQPSVREESDRLITIAKKVGDYIPSTIWETFGDKVNIPSAESIVFTDEEHGRVIKIKNPFVTAYMFGSATDAIYQHHIHNRFFKNASYRLLGISRDPDFGNARFVFEQQFIDTKTKPTEDEIKNWFKERGFHQSEDGFFFTDGYVSFTDVLNNDNCLKDAEGNLLFIDPMIKFDVSPKQVIEHYIERDRQLFEKLEMADIHVGSRFRIDRMCSFNDLQVKDISLAHGLITFNHMTTHPDYQYDVTWPIDRFLDNIKLSQGSRWIMTDENRKDIVIPEARKAVLERAKDPSPHAAFTDEQVKALNRFTTLYSEDNSKESIFNGLLQRMHDDFKKEGICKEWIDDVKEELLELAKGERREISEGLKR